MIFPRCLSLSLSRSQLPHHLSLSLVNTLSPRSRCIPRSRFIPFYLFYFRFFFFLFGSIFREQPPSSRAPSSRRRVYIMFREFLFSRPTSPVPSCLPRGAASRAENRRRHRPRRGRPRSPRISINTRRVFRFSFSSPTRPLHPRAPRVSSSQRPLSRNTRVALWRAPRVPRHVSFNPTQIFWKHISRTYASTPCLRTRFSRASRLYVGVLQVVRGCTAPIHFVSIICKR